MAALRATFGPGLPLMRIRSNKKRMEGAFLLVLTPLSPIVFLPLFWRSCCVVLPSGLRPWLGRLWTLPASRALPPPDSSRARVDAPAVFLPTSRRSPSPVWIWRKEPGPSNVASSFCLLVLAWYDYGTRNRFMILTIAIPKSTSMVIVRPTRSR